MTTSESLKKTLRSIDLALLACRKRQSPRTGFVHLFPFEETSDTIPLYENFCFALALFRQKTAESVLEAKQLIDRLLAFQGKEGNFPTYLHEYPKCWDLHLALKIAPILIHILRDFDAVLNSEWKEKVNLSLEQALLYSKSKEIAHPTWRHRLKACLGMREKAPFPTSPEGWFDWLISEQLFEKNGQYPIPYHPEFQLVIGDSLSQERGEPSPYSIEYLLAESSLPFQERLLRDHPQQILAAALFPFSSSQIFTGSLIHHQTKEALRFVWKGISLHTLVCPLGIWNESKGEMLFDLVKSVEPEKEDLFEISCFCDLSPETSIWIEGQKGMVFRLGERVVIRSGEHSIMLCFRLAAGEGDFLGHISKANRPGQILSKGRNSFDVFDWKIGLRTLRRKGNVQIVGSISQD